MDIRNQMGQLLQDYVAAKCKKPNAILVPDTKQQELWRAFAVGYISQPEKTNEMSFYGVPIYICINIEEIKVI